MLTKPWFVKIFQAQEITTDRRRQANYFAEKYINKIPKIKMITILCCGKYQNITKAKK